MKVSWSVTPEEVLDAWVDSGLSGLEATQWLMGYLSQKAVFPEPVITLIGKTITSEDLSDE